MKSVLCLALLGLVPFIAALPGAAAAAPAGLLPLSFLPLPLSSHYPFLQSSTSRTDNLLASPLLS